MNAICSQLLTPDDINISEDFFTKIEKEKIIVQVLIEDETAAIRIYSQQALMLSLVMPVLHHFGFNIIDEVAFSFEQNDSTIHLKRFNLNLVKIDEIKRAKSNIEKVITQALKGESFKVSQLFSLVCVQNLNLRQLSLLKALIDYMNQAVLSINLGSFLHTLTTQSEMSTLFLHYFNTKFNPTITSRKKKMAEIEELIETNIKEVPNITDDKILKLTYALIQSTVRTNYFFDQESIAFKIDTGTFAQNLKGLQPRIETFVSHKDFSGVHLRMSNISRGGLRWSERHDDFRTEIKSLMITQEGKNAIIIPDGAKGGFVIHREKSEITKEFFKEKYSCFINNLLDLVDNRVDGEVVCNKKVIAYDDEDPYFVVAADKGTAAMSDVANAIAVERNFWLGDAFASGGSNGFGHKELGITAKGSLKSSERFFLEKGVNFREESVTVVGIGSMNGDVFGNGLLESKYFKLLGAISHKEIFIDPNPIPASSYEERQRLFIAKDGSWSAYNHSLISSGGGVFLRSDKAIELTSEIQKMLGTKRAVISGEELARMLLCMKVDLLFNGGVGTYVKHSEESNLDLGDKQNEAVRIDASELQCEIVCEGGNLGLTQRARIEYAVGGGKINIDGIDNAAGVDTSDHEVNLKILLNILKEKGLINEKESQDTLQSLTQQVVNMVLWSNYRQALSLSRDEMLSRLYPNDFNITIDILSENIEAFNRRDFFIPKTENIKSILTEDGTIVRPVLSSLLSYSKIFIKKLLLESTLIDEDYSVDFLYKYFPKSFVSVYEHEVKSHPLRRQIIATVIADTVINLQGASFIHDYNRLGEDKFLDKVKSYLIGNNLFGANDIRFEIFRHDYSMPLTTQYELLSNIERTLTFSTKWMLNYLDSEQIDSAHILDYKDRLYNLLNTMDSAEIDQELVAGNEHFNRFFSTIDYLRFAVAAIVIKEHTDNSFENVANLFYLIFRQMKIMKLLKILDELKINEDADRALKAQMLHYIEFIVVNLTQKILTFQRVGESPQEAFDNYLNSNTAHFEKTVAQIDKLLSEEHKEVKEVVITINQLMVMAI
ncbi:MAG: NAD-glutamate dehydrogenase domain-containing protein [Campylobacterota bacterium]